MDVLSELEWVQFKDIKGALILTDVGIYFQPYDISKGRPYPLGDSLAINRAGLFGAAHMHRKLDKVENTFAEIARAVRLENGLKKLVDEGSVTFIDWNNIVRAKNRRVMGVVELITGDGNKVIITDPDDREAVLNIAIEHIQQFKSKSQ